MKKIVFFCGIAFLSASCSSRYSKVSLNKMDKERKEIAQNFAETYLKKCAQKEYSDFKDFNISAKFKSRILSDSLKKSCDRITRNYGTVKIEKLVSAHSTNYPKNFIDVFNFKIINDKNPKIQYLHLGMYRDQNFIEVPFYFTKEENYFDYSNKKYLEYKKKEKLKK